MILPGLDIESKSATYIMREFCKLYFSTGKRKFSTEMTQFSTIARSAIVNFRVFIGINSKYFGFLQPFLVAGAKVAKSPLLNLKLATTSTDSSLYFDNTVGSRHRRSGESEEFLKELHGVLDWECIV